MCITVCLHVTYIYISYNNIQVLKYLVHMTDGPSGSFVTGSNNVTCHELFFLVLLQVKWMCQPSARCCQYYLSISCMLFVILLKVGPKPRLFHPNPTCGKSQACYTKLCRDLSSPKIRRKETAQRPKLYRLTGMPAAKQPRPKSFFSGWFIRIPFADSDI